MCLIAPSCCAICVACPLAKSHFFAMLSHPPVNTLAPSLDHELHSTGASCFVDAFGIACPLFATS
jgi:hypothetical protein